MEVKLVLVVLCLCQFRVHADDNIMRNNIPIDNICEQIKSNVTTVSSIDETEEERPGERRNMTSKSEGQPMRNKPLDESEPTSTLEENKSSEGTGMTYSIPFWANATSTEKYWKESNTTAQTGMAHSIHFWGNATRYLNESSTSDEMDTTHPIHVWANATQDWNESNTNEEMGITFDMSDMMTDTDTTKGMSKETELDKNKTGSTKQDDITMGSNEQWSDSTQDDITTESSEHWSDSTQENITMEPSEHWLDSKNDNITTRSNEDWSGSMEHDNMSSLTDLGLNMTASSSFSNATESYEHAKKKLSKTTTSMVETDASNISGQSSGSRDSDYEITRPEYPDSNHPDSDGFTRPQGSDSNYEFTRPECPCEKLDKFSEEENHSGRLSDEENSNDESHDSIHEFTRPECPDSGRKSIRPSYPDIACSKCNTASCKSGKKSNRYSNTEQSTFDGYSQHNDPTSLNVIPRSVRRITVDPHDIRRTRRQIKIIKPIGSLTSYAGFFQTNPDHDAHLFFWFFRSKKNWKKAPVIVWLQGEPGLSSLYGLFEEHGPYQIQNTTKGLKMQLREFTWINLYNVLYLDHCIGCGFSLARTEQAYIPSYQNVGQNVYEALYQFYRIFPEYKNNQLYLAGSYGCAKYIPVIGDLIHSKNRFSKVSMNLKGMLIGAPYTDAAAMAKYSSYLHEHKIINSNETRSLSKQETYIQELINAKKYHRAIRHLEKCTFSLIRKAGYEHLYDIRHKKQSNDTYKLEYIPKIVKGDQFRKMICLSQMSFQHKSKVLIPEIMDSVNHLIVELLEHYKILFYAGQWDLMAPPRISLPYLLNLRWSNIDSFYISETHSWCAMNSTQPCMDGTYKNYQTLTTLVLYKTGHTFGSLNSKKSLHLLKAFIEGSFHHMGVPKPVY